MWLTMAVLSFAFAVSLAAWLVLGRVWRAWVTFDGQVRRDARRTLEASFLFLDEGRIWVAAWAAGTAVILVIFWLGGSGWLAIPVLGGLLAFPRLALRNLRRRRERRFDAQLPDLVQALAGALRAGAGVQPALQHIVAQTLPPLSQEFGLMLREQRLGLAFQDALYKLRERMPTESCGLVVSALSIAAQTGGSLADTLEGIAQTLRARQHWLGRVQALTAQGRMQSHIMAGLPILLLFVLSRLEPEAMGKLWSTAVGWAVLLVIFILECLGTFWIRRIVAVEV